MQTKGGVFVVTGGGNGIGRAVVLALLARGARVAAVDLSEAGLAETAGLAFPTPTASPSGALPGKTRDQGPLGGALPGKMRDLGGGRLTLHTLNITDRAAVQALPAKVIAEHGQVDGVLNVAGIVQRFARVQDLDYEEIQRVMDVNFWGVVNMCKAFLPLLLQRPQASLVNVSSMGALAPVPGQSAYGASKAAVKLLTEGLYAELRGTRVAVTVVFPGGVGTNILANSGVNMRGRNAESGGSKLTTAADAGRQIVEAVERGAFRVRIGGDARMLDRLSRLMPQRATTLIAKRMGSLLDS